MSPADDGAEDLLRGFICRVKLRDLRRTGFRATGSVRRVRLVLIDDFEVLVDIHSHAATSNFVSMILAYTYNVFDTRHRGFAARMSSR
jgi:hypothetical protein